MALRGGSVTNSASAIQGQIAVANGGTGAATLTNHGVLIGQATAAVVATSAGTAGQVLTSGGASADPGWTTVLPVANGGTGAASGSNPLSVTAAGTVYSLTNTQAAVTFGTTSPTLTLTVAGTYLIIATFRLDNNGATTAADRTATLKLRRTNNTAADLTGASNAIQTGIVTTVTNTLACATIAVTYATALTSDIISLFGAIDTVPSAGTLDVGAASIVAIRLAV